MKTVFIVFSFLMGSVALGQSTSQLQNFSTDCSTDFFTITATGHIQQWKLNNGSIKGGDTVLSGGGTSLAFCGNKNSPYFYSNNSAAPGIMHYLTGFSTWLTTFTPNAVNDNGGHLNDQFFKVEGAIIQLVKYWDGSNLITVDSLQGEFFAGVADIAVDTMGQAWIFTGHAPWVADTIKVYDKNGLVNAYSILYYHDAYGSFFLNDTLYVGTDQDSIYPVLVNGSSAQLGNGIYFPAGNFTDMASCQETPPIPHISVSEHSKAKLKPFPNPTSGQLTIPSDIEASEITVHNAQGQSIEVRLHSNVLDLTDQPGGIYIIQINSQGRQSSHKVMKL